MRTCSPCLKQGVGLRRPITTSLAVYSCPARYPGLGALSKLAYSVQPVMGGAGLGYRVCGVTPGDGRYKKWWRARQPHPCFRYRRCQRAGAVAGMAEWLATHPISGFDHALAHEGWACRKTMTCMRLLLSGVRPRRIPCRKGWPSVSSRLTACRWPMSCLPGVFPLGKGR